MIDQNATHYLRGDGEEVGTISPVNVPLIYQANVSFVNQCGGL
jgi:hypothetical protein